MDLAEVLAHLALAVAFLVLSGALFAYALEPVLWPFLELMPGG